MKTPMHPAIRQLLRATERLVQAELDDSWAGGGDPEDSDLCAERLKKAKESMQRALDRVAKEMV